MLPFQGVIPKLLVSTQLKYGFPSITCAVDKLVSVTELATPSPNILF